MTLPLHQEYNICSWLHFRGDKLLLLFGYSFYSLTAREFEYVSECAVECIDCCSPCIVDIIETPMYGKIIIKISLKPRPHCLGLPAGEDKAEYKTIYNFPGHWLISTNRWLCRNMTGTLSLKTNEHNSWI